jgi:hypothetical protein
MVGALVGGFDIVGAFVGARVGATVGSIVGAVVGEIVGASVGANVGATVGACVGARVVVVVCLKCGVTGLYVTTVAFGFPVHSTVVSVSLVIVVVGITQSQSGSSVVS